MSLSELNDGVESLSFVGLSFPAAYPYHPTREASARERPSALLKH